MKIIKNLIDIDLKHSNQKHLLINGNNGLADYISPEDYVFLKKWCIYENVELAETENPMLYRHMINREYIVPDSYNEEEIRNGICERIKDTNEKKTRKFCRVHFLLSYACNFACPYCYEKSHQSSRLSFEQIDKIFSMYDDEIRDIGFFGGEPLLPGNMDVIKYIISKAPSATYNVTTNGYYLDEFIDILEQINVVSLQITLDGSREQHNKTRILTNGKGTFDKVIGSIKLALQRGLPTTVRMNVSPENIDDSRIIWVSSDESIAKVTDGIVSAQDKGGKAVVKAVSASDETVYAQCLITVREVVTEIKLSETEFTMTAGDKKTVTATILPESATDKTVIWTSGDSSVATVEGGVITAVSAGVVEITITSVRYGVSAKCRVTVSAKA